jgi:hypothetical protein
MDLLTPAIRAALIANGEAASVGKAGLDPVPIVKWFNPVGAATWLVTEMDADGDTLFGLADLGFQCPEMGSFSLSEIASLRLPFGLSIERDLTFETDRPLSEWAEVARHRGSISDAEQWIARAPPRPANDSFPSRTTEDG